MKHTYSITIKGNDTFEHTDEYRTGEGSLTPFTQAFAYAQELLNAFQRNSIEQLRITQIEEIK